MDRATARQAGPGLPADRHSAGNAAVFQHNGNSGFSQESGDAGQE
jgi:hypothetical protein